MKIEKGKLVSLEYDLYVEDYNGELIESIKDNEPAMFLCGEGEMLESFEAKLMGMKAGDKFKFSLSKAEAYGEEEADAFAEFPKEIFLSEENKELPEVGEYVPMQDEEGNSFDGIVADITDESLTVDFNHPLAGEDLFFVGKVLKVEEAPEE